MCPFKPLAIYPCVVCFCAFECTYGSMYLLQRCFSQWRAIGGTYNVMEIVGGFLGDLLQNHTLPRRSTRVVRRPSSVSQFPGMSGANQFLHHAPKYCQSQLVRLIVSIYGGVPESFEVFHCRSSSTKEELTLFLERVERKPLRYLILEVNRLPFRLQEVHVHDTCTIIHVA